MFYTINCQFSVSCFVHKIYDPSLAKLRIYLCREEMLYMVFFFVFFKCKIKVWISLITNQACANDKSYIWICASPCTVWQMLTCLFCDGCSMIVNKKWLIWTNWPNRVHTCVFKGFLLKLQATFESREAIWETEMFTRLMTSNTVLKTCLTSSDKKKNP